MSLRDRRQNHLRQPAFLAGAGAQRLACLSPNNDLAEKEPPLFHVAILNDDFTPMNFVISVLRLVLHLSREEAMLLTFRAHKNGQAACGAFSRDIAETKAQEINGLALRNGHPLQSQAQPIPRV